MIKANELRIGNYVSYSFPFHKILEVKEDSVILTGITHLKRRDHTKGIERDDADVSTGGAILESLKPIDLTPEILEKCGFEENLGGWYLGINIPNGFINFEKDNNDNMTGGCTIGLSDKMPITSTAIDHVKYLHQLQNLYFALTGDELQINI